MNYKGEIRIQGIQEGSKTDPITIPCKVDEVEALQKVYAAAPDLLAACEYLNKTMFMYDDDCPEWLENIREAIAKATRTKGDVTEGNKGEK